MAFENLFWDIWKDNNISNNFWSTENLPNIKNNNEIKQNDKNEGPENNYFEKLKELNLSDEQIDRIENIVKKWDSWITIEEIFNELELLNTDEDIENAIQEIEELQTIKIQENATKLVDEELINRYENTKENYENLAKEIINKIALEYPWIADKFKPTEEEIINKKTEIENNPIITEKLNSEWIDINSYINYSITREKIIKQWGLNDENLKSFVEDINRLDDLLWIPRITAKWYPLTYNENLITTWTEDLKNELKKDWKIQSLESETSIKEWIESLWECLALAKLYWFKWEYNEEELSALQWKSNLTQEEITSIKNFTSNEDMKKILETHNERINNYVGWYTVQSPIFSIINYLDYSNTPTELSLANQISQTDWTNNLENNRVQYKEWTINISGFIDWNPITIYYDLNSENHNLKCDDILHIENKIITLNDTEHWKTDLKINMPTINDIVNNFKDIPYKEILKNSKDLDEYKKTIAETLRKKTKDLYPDNNEVKRRLNKNIEKNLTTQEICSTLIPKKFQNWIDNNLQQTSDTTPLRKMLTTIDNTTEHNTLSKIKEFKQWFKTLNSFINECINHNQNDDNQTNPINKIKDPLIKQYIENIRNTLMDENYSDANYIQRENTISNFFSIFSTEQISNNGSSLNINALNSFIKHINNWEIINDTNIEWFSTNFKEEHTKMIAEENLDTGLKEIN